MIFSHRLVCSFLNTTANKSGSGKRPLASMRAINTHGSKGEIRERSLALAARLSEGFTGEKLPFPILFGTENVARELPKIGQDTLGIPEVSMKSLPNAVKQPTALRKREHSDPKQLRASYTITATVGKSSKRSSSSRLVENAVADERSHRGFAILRAVQGPRDISSNHRLKASRLGDTFSPATSRSQTSPRGDAAYIHSTHVAPIVGGFRAPPHPRKIDSDLRQQVDRSSHLQALQALSRPLRPVSPALDKSARSDRPEHRSSGGLKAIASDSAADRPIRLEPDKKTHLTSKEGFSSFRSPHLAVFQKATRALTAASGRGHLEHAGTRTNGTPSLLAAAHRRAVPPSAFPPVDRNQSQLSPVSASVLQVSASRPQVGSQHRTNQSSSTPVVVNLVGDVVVDGRHLGRIAASSQAREASLPAHGPSRVNLRTVPLYPGMQIPR